MKTAASMIDHRAARPLLAPHVFLALTEQGAVFLDLKRDKYLGLGTSNLAAIRSLVDGPDVTTSSMAAELATELLNQGLLTSEADKGKPVATTTVDIARCVLAEAFTDERPTVATMDVCNFVRAWVTAKMSLLRGMQYTVERIQKRRARYSKSEFDIERARRLVQVFRHIRPLFYTAKDRCLLNSAVLIEFLAANQVFPDWVFAVKTAPFRAHCWVQKEGYLFNDLPEAIAPFAPIMAV